jgi:hypothetical protein
MSAFEEITTAHFVINGFERMLFTSDSGVAGYGAGWGRNGLLGYDVGNTLTVDMKFVI